MNQVLPLSRRLCTRNAGLGMLSSTIIISFVFISLDTIFEVPGEATLTVAKGIGANGLFFVIMIISILIMLFFNLMVAASSFNVFKTVNRDLALLSSVSRLIEVVFFTISIALVFSEISFFTEVYLIGHLFYGLHLIFIGYLVFKSHFLNRIGGIFLIIGGSIGYLIESLTHFYLPNFIWLTYLGLLVALLAEIVLGILLVMKAIKMTMELPDPKETITMILEELGEATTEEIIKEASQVSRDCKDRIPNTLVTLEEENKIIKRISKEKKALVWRLVRS